MGPEEQQEYEIAEKETSRSVAEMVNLLFRFHRPTVICMTTASLLNTTHPGDDISRAFAPLFSTVIGDEASQIPELALAAIASRFCGARQIYIGDRHQLEPHARCHRSSNIAQFGARGVITVLLDSPTVPVAPLVTTFRSHPGLVALPNVVAYNGELVSGTAPESRELLISHMRFPPNAVPFLFLNIIGQSEKAASHSHHNPEEARICVNLIRQLQRNGIQAYNICVISFYKEQSRRLQARLDSLGVELTTVDSVQGPRKRS